MNSPKITKYLEDVRLLGEDRLKLVLALRAEVLSLNDSISEEIKYGGILFASDQAFCGIFSYSKHVSLEFGEGASLPDRHQVLEGAGKLRRHIKLMSPEDISNKHVHEYLELAFNAATKP